MKCWTFPQYYLLLTLTLTLILILFWNEKKKDQKLFLCGIGCLCQNDKMILRKKWLKNLIVSDNSTGWSFLEMNETWKLRKVHEIKKMWRCDIKQINDTHYVLLERSILRTLENRNWIRYHNTHFLYSIDFKVEKKNRKDQILIVCCLKKNCFLNNQKYQKTRNWLLIRLIFFKISLK